MRRQMPISPSRRRFLLGSVAVTGLTGCLGSSGRPEPVALTDPSSCDQCGMVITQQPGPSGQTYYQEHSPEGHDPPARFCSAVCAFRHRFATENQGWTPQVTYLTDYASVDYRIDEADGTPVISAHLEAEYFASTDGLDVVTGAEIEGAMGPALVPFSDSDQAETFASEHGGNVIAAESVSRELVARQ